jgi:hypothetical protein
MEKEFIEYEQALALKELGFDEPCFGFYDESLYFPNNENQYGTFCNQPLDAPSCSAPLYQQVFRWFREKGIENEVHSDFDRMLGYNRGYTPVVQFIEFYNNGDCYETYQEAELECLKKLIEIVKKQKEDESNIIV